MPVVSIHQLRIFLSMIDYYTDGTTDSEDNSDVSSEDSLEDIEV